MAGTYSKMNAHIVFALKHRTFAIQANWKGELNKYICGIIQGKNVKPIIANSAGDHIHILISFKPSVNISDLVRDIKNNSTNFINRRCFTQRTFFVARRVWMFYLLSFGDEEALYLHSGSRVTPQNQRI